MRASSTASRSTLSFIFVTIFIDVLGYGMLVPLLPFYAQQFSDGAAWAGGLRALYAACQLVAGPVLGALSDRYGRRPVLLICLLGTAGAYLLTGLARSLEWLVLAVALDGLTGGNLTTAQAYLADRTAPHDRTRAFGLMGAAIALGSMAGPAFGGLLSVYGLGTPAFVAAAIALGNVIFGATVLPESLPPERRSTASSTVKPLAQLIGLLRLEALRYLLFSVFMLNLIFNGLQTVFPLYTRERFGWDARVNGLFFAFLGLCAVITQGYLVGRLQPRLGEKRLVLIGLGLMMGAIAAVAPITSDAWLYPVVAGAAVGSSLALPALSGLISSRVAASEQGKLLGGLQTLIALAMIAGPALSGAAFDLFSAEMLPWLGATFVGVAWASAWAALRHPIVSPLADEASSHVSEERSDRQTLT